MLRKSVSRGMQQRKINYKTQSEAFEDCMKIFVLFGKSLGIFPFLPKKRNIKYALLWWRYILAFVICLTQLMCFVFYILGIAKTSLNIGKISQIIYFGKSSLCSILIIRLAKQWNVLLKQVASFDLNEYIDSSVKCKCVIATIAFISLTFLNKLILEMSKLATILDCQQNNTNLYEQYTLRVYNWFFRTGVPFSLPVGILLSVIDLISVFNFTYIEIFIVCVSLYLSSIMEQVNKKIHLIDCKYVSSSYWRKLRQDYNQVTRIVRSFDEFVNGFVFLSFAYNLYLVCLQVYLVLRNDITVQHGYSLCPINVSSGFLDDYDSIISKAYFVYSSVYFIVRSLIVSFIATKVHSTSLEIAPILYSVPPPTYCIEIQRFIEQIHGNTVALTGLKFFYCTKEVILSMIGTVITYELVLLQFN